MSRKSLLFGLAVMGAAVPYSALVVFLVRYGVDLSRLGHEVFASPGATFFALDVVMGAVSLIVVVLTDTTRGWPRWPPIVATLLIGPSCAWPLYLGLRETRTVTPA
jgi:hypothetical protein